MLKALELSGFKSFADKVRFEFDKGITAVVGPNGSGKSNVVDGIKWVLGEQSVKSLRGKEMADVIFNGSGSRRMINMAEATMTFDNSTGLFPLDTKVVHITRRVYRSGEGEYLINWQPARLKDIRDMLLGKGIGTNAYSIIEQGKVDSLLQASPKDRRQIFEEAAGISRFKSKKVESLRRLERVDQNLVRLADIVEEVENQLRSVRSQAGKAKKYKEYTDRLQELRTHVGLVDWRRQTFQLKEFENQISELNEGLNAAKLELGEFDQQRQEIDKKLGQLSSSIRESEQRVAENRERIATAESTIEHERGRSRDLEEEISLHRRQLAALSARSGGLKQLFDEIVSQVSEAENRHHLEAHRLTDLEKQFAESNAQIEAWRSEISEFRTELRGKMKAAASLAGEISSLESQRELSEKNEQKMLSQLNEIETQRASLEENVENLQAKSVKHQETISQHERLVTEAQQLLEERREQRAHQQTELSLLQGRLAGAKERVSILEDLEKRHEGVSPGVKQVLAASEEDPAGPFGSVKGMVADVINVSVETAPIIEVALGEVAQFLVCQDRTAIFQQQAKEPFQLAGRVGFVPLEETFTPPHIDLLGERGVIGRADSFVETDEDYKQLAVRLLGNTWVVETLAHALQLQEKYGSDTRFVSLAGELLAPNGALTIGPRQSSTGLISRRSELRELKELLNQLKNEIVKEDSLLLELQKEVESDLERVKQRLDAKQEAHEDFATHKNLISIAQGRLDDVAEQKLKFESELEVAKQKVSTATESLSMVHGQLEAEENSVNSIESDISKLHEQISQHEILRDEKATASAE